MSQNTHFLCYFLVQNLCLCYFLRFFHLWLLLQLMAAAVVVSAAVAVAVAVAAAVALLFLLFLLFLLLLSERTSRVGHFLLYHCVMI